MSERLDVTALLEGTTPGPWQIDATVPTDDLLSALVICVDGPLPDTATVLVEAYWATDEDMALIAAAPTLAAEVDALRAEREEAERLLERACERIDLTRNVGGPALRYDIQSFLASLDKENPT